MPTAELYRTPRIEMSPDSLNSFQIFCGAKLQAVSGFQAVSCWNAEAAGLWKETGCSGLRSEVQRGRDATTNSGKAAVIIRQIFQPSPSSYLNTSPKTQTPSVVETKSPFTQKGQSSNRHSVTVWTGNVCSRPNDYSRNKLRIHLQNNNK